MQCRPWLHYQALERLNTLSDEGLSLFFCTIAFLATANHPRGVVALQCCTKATLAVTCTAFTDPINFLCVAAVAVAAFLCNNLLPVHVIYRIIAQGEAQAPKMHQITFCTHSKRGRCLQSRWN